MSQAPAPVPASTVTRSKSERRRLLVRAVGITITLVGLLSGITGVFQFVGVTHVPFISNFIHPGADQILAKAKSAGFQDMSCTIQSAHALNSQPGPCAFVNSPGVTEYAFSLPLGGYDYLLFDVGSKTMYEKGPAEKLWHKSKPQCQVAQPCLPDFMETLSAYYDVRDLQFDGVESISGKDTYHIEGQRTDAQSFSGVELIKEDFWFLQDSFYPARIIAQLSPSADPSNVADTLTLDFTGYNEGVTITVPSGNQIQP